ncbi:integrin alpha-PS4, partial [Eurytemora carolleeae]|uniref:integrin alpha-PS4 n=1 Tax=Eurytemora carolleeae TaxID=1294199 RepID=UPI000C786CA0
MFYSTSPGGKKMFFGVGIYGFSATITDSGSLIVGGPYNPQLDGSQIHLYTGLISEVEKGQIKFPSSNPTPPFSYGNGISRWTNPNYFLAGYFVGKGKFSDGERELIIGAPGADFHTGKLYVCGNCNGIRSDFKNQELQGNTGGEGFGFTAAACDINGDGKDDLLIGAPFYTANNKNYDTGAVYVYTNRWNKNDRFKFNLEKTNMLGEEMIKKVSGAMFGRSIACLGDTDFDGKQEVVVGAPFYGETDKPGAIFIFKSFLKPDSLDTEPSQIIYGTSPEFSGPAGFGFRFAVPNSNGDKINFDNTQPSSSRAEEFSVSAPHSRQVFKLRFKKVIRINDTTRPM